MKGKNAKKETEKDKGKKDNSQKGKGKNDKNKKKIEEEEEEIPLPPPEKPYNLERFIYVTTYYDSSAMQKIKELFEEINQQAFQLRSVKEIYTRNLSDEERDNNEIDYISGVQLLDKNIRITLIEGITDKAMAKIKEKLPKYQMNNNTFMVFSDKNVLFNKRIYSKFDLSLKYIKLRDTLQSILTTFPIYMKADKYKEIYNAFLNFGSILNSKTMKEIAHAELFSDADALLMLERKYADILNDEDMTGVKQVKKKKKKMMKLDALERQTMASTVTSGFSFDINKIDNKKKDNKENEDKENKNKENKDDKDDKDDKNKQIEINKERDALREKLDSMNLEYEKALQNYVPESKGKTIQRNINYIKTMKKKRLTERFCLPDLDSDFTDEVHFQSITKNNFYIKVVDKMRDKYLHDKNNYYTYSNYGLAMAFPLVQQRNEEYYQTLQNKKKWVSPKDFDRYIQPSKEKYYFPKINNIL